MKLPTLTRVAAVLLLFAWGDPVPASEPSWPDPTDPLAGMGVCIHFTDAKRGELEMLAKAGFHWVRMDFVWENTEKQSGVYDFSAYDRLLASLDKFHIRALLILDYTNKLYDGGRPTDSDEGRAAFARWGTAAALHFAGRGVLWEIWNEPNGEWFWKPKSDADAYAKLALTVSAAMKAAAPHECVIGPALANIDLHFVEVAAKAGVFPYWSGVTIHPYRRTGPETYGPVYDATRELIHRYAAPGQKLDVMCGESGYSTSWMGMTDELQGQYVARLFLFDVMKGVPLTILYDWHDDGEGPFDPEAHFGTVRYPYAAGSAEVYMRKPAYNAAQTYARELEGFRFVKRVDTGSDQDYLLAFSMADRECLVAWTTGAPHQGIIRLSPGTYAVTGFDGKTKSTLHVVGVATEINFDGGPQYLKRMDAGLD